MHILIYNQKGGVGKTTTAVNLAAGLAAEGQTVVVADLDPQLHLTAALGGKAAAAGANVRDWLGGQAVVPAAMAARPNLGLIAGHADALDLPVASIRLPEVGVDWVVMDAPPLWSDAMTRIIGLSNLVICPVEPDFLGLSSLSQLLAKMQETGLPLARVRILITRYSNRLAVHRDVRGRLIDTFGSEAVLPVVVRSSVRLAEAPGQGQTVFEHAPGSTGASDYAQLSRALIAERSLGKTNGKASS